jgi:hypothetical protein
MEDLVVFLNDSIVNLDKAVVVFLNGEKVFDDKVLPSLDALFDSIARRQDPAIVFTAKIAVDPRR